MHAGTVIALLIVLKDDLPVTVEGVFEFVGDP
jgi:hypothetical protein